MEDSFEKRAAARRKTMTGHVAHSIAGARVLERARDEQLEPFQRAEAIWGLVRDLAAVRGSDGSELRLDRSLARVERRGR
jgi:hypothetical protein